MYSASVNLRGSALEVSTTVSHPNCGRYFVSFSARSVPPLLSGAKAVEISKILLN
jgi:hypothetical protein